jgi:hypothetical protein
MCNPKTAFMHCGFSSIFLIRLVSTISNKPYAIQRGPVSSVEIVNLVQLINLSSTIQLLKSRS